MTISTSLLAPVCVATVVAGLIACSSSSSSSSSGTSGGLPPPGQDAGTEKAELKGYGQAVCAMNQRCRAKFVQVKWGGVAECEGAITATTESLGEQPGFVVTQQQLDACAASLASRSCDDIDLQSPECDFKGTLEEGSACKTGTQCTTGSCFIKSGSECGICSTPSPAGGDCSKAECAIGLSCAENLKCVERRGIGAACDATTKPCKSTMDCVKGVCQHKLGKDAPCSDLEEAQCDAVQALACFSFVKGTPTKCVELGLAKIGEKCGIDTVANTATVCIASTCPTLDAATCVPYLAEGAACGTDDASCADDLACKAGTCTRPLCE